ncbi:hypothetical protein LWC35_06140 [Pseudonocardia kujensis]|uniref:hypothetical protein n=1 Tax=Pseudonocardia kujensis TaxID=1128675 RepID=UPI001E4AF4C2|nr:hypothetical protein [Pseudonocardia kujensis]MCE0762491.1 hypothetical protein [Pseudonocardia kujensis]
MGSGKPSDVGSGIVVGLVVVGAGVVVVVAGGAMVAVVAVGAGAMVVGPGRPGLVPPRERSTSYGVTETLQPAPKDTMHWPTALRRHAPGGVDPILDTVGDRTQGTSLVGRVRKAARSSPQHSVSRNGLLAGDRFVP